MIPLYLSEVWRNFNIVPYIAGIVAHDIADYSFYEGVTIKNTVAFLIALVTKKDFLDKRLMPEYCVFSNTGV